MTSPSMTNRLLKPQGAIAQAASIAFVRIFIGIMWLFEITFGHNWKIGNPLWMGPQAGEYVAETSGTAIADGTWAGAAWIFQAIVMPNAAFVGYLTITLQLALAFAFIVGIAVRPMALAVIVMDLSIFMLGNSRIPPFFITAHLFLLVTGAGVFYGADGFILRMTSGATNPIIRFVRWAIELPVFRRSFLVPAAAAVAMVALFFFLTITSRETTRMANVGLDLAAIAGLVALGLYTASRIADRLAVVAASLRIFIGFKFLHEIWTRTDPGINALPGFAGADAQSEVFATVVANHWAPMAAFVDVVILPSMGLWVVVFGAIQLAVGVMLVLGYRTRLASVVGLLFLGAMIALGMTRYAPFVFGLLTPVLALDAGRVLSLDSLRTPAHEARARFGLPIPQRLVPVMIVLSAAFAAAATISVIVMGIEPDAYVGSMMSMTAAFAAIILGLLAFVGWLQHHPRFDHSGEIAASPLEPVALQPIGWIR